MKDLLLDYETQAVVSITNPAYTSHEETQIICMSWGFKANKAIYGGLATPFLRKLSTM